MHGFGWVDTAIVGVVLISVVIGVFRGFVKEALSLVNWVFSIWMAVVCHDRAIDWFSHVIQNETVRSIAAFGVVLVTVLFVGSLVTYLVCIMVRKSGLGGTDRLLGVIFGLTRGVFLVALGLTVVSYSSLKEQPWWQDSSVIPRFQPLMVWLNDMVPDQISVAKDTLFKKPGKDIDENQVAEVGLEDLAEIKLLEDDD